MKFVKAALPLLFSGALLAAGAAQAAQKDVTVAVASTFTTLDPYNASDTLSQAVVKSFYEGLFSFDKDMKLVNVLAESYEASPDGLVYTVKLRKGVKFQNGEDFTADAVKINYERVMDKKNSLKRYVLFSNIDRIDVVDAHTVKFTLKKPFSAFINQLAHPSGGMICPKELEKWGAQIAFHPCGTGPFVMKDYNPAEVLKVEKNPNYWRAGYPKVDSITFKPVVENSTRVAMLLTGEAQYAFPLPAEQVKQIEKRDNVRVDVTPSIIMRYVEMNMTKKPFQDIRVRQALNYAINKKALVKVAFNGYADPATGVAPMNVDYAVKLGPWPYDPKKARELLKEAGYPNGFRVTLWSGYNHSTAMKIIQFLQQQLAQVGVKADIRALEAGQRTALVESVTPEKSEHQLLHRLVELHGRNGLRDPSASCHGKLLAQRFERFLLFEQDGRREAHGSARHHRPREEGRALRRHSEADLARRPVDLPRYRAEHCRCGEEPDGLLHPARCKLQLLRA